MADEALRKAKQAEILAGSQAPTGQSSDVIKQRLLKNAVFILPTDPDHGLGGFGSGTLVHTSRRLVVTTSRAVAEETRVGVFFPAYEVSGELITSPARYARKADLLRVWGKVIARNPRADLAVVELEQIPDRAAALPLAERPAAIGSIVYSIGSSRVNRRTFSGALWQLSTGTVRSRVHDTFPFGDGQTVEAMFLRTQEALSHWDSGGPVANDRGELVGVVSTPDPRTESIGQNIDITDVRALLSGVADVQGWTWEDHVAAPLMLVDQPPPTPLTPTDLVTRAKAGDPDARVEAIRQLGALGASGRAAVPTLVELLDDGNERIRRMAASALDQIGPPSPEDLGCLDSALAGGGKFGRLYALQHYSTVVKVSREQLPRVVALLDATDAEIREAAIRAIGFYGPAAKPIVFAKLIDRVADSDPAVAASAGTVLNAFAPYDAADRQVLVDHLTSTEWHLRALSIHLLAPIARDETTALAWFEPRLTDEVPQVRGAAARALTRWGPAVKRIIPALIRLTQDENGKVRTAAVRAIGATRGGPGALPAVARLLDPDTPPSLRGAAAAALAQIDATDPEADLPVLAGLLKSGDPVTTPTVLAKLAGFGPATKATLPDVVALLKNPDPGIQFAALQVIAGVGLDAAQYAPRVFDVMVRRARGDPRVAGIPAPPSISPPGPAPLPSGDQLAERLTSSAVWVVADRFGRPAGAGCGTLVDRAGRLVLTTSQVAAAGDTFTIFFPFRDGGGLRTDPAYYLHSLPRLQKDGFATTGRVILADPRTALAVIQLDSPPPFGAVALPLALLGAQPGQPLYEVGTAGALHPSRPGGAMWRYTPGRAGTLADHPLTPNGVGNCRVLETDLPVGQWDGGSAIANANGELVGVNIATDPHRRGVGFAVELNTVRATVTAAARAIGLPFPTTQPPSPPPPGAAVQDPVPAVVVDGDQVLHQAVSTLAHLGPTAIELLAKTLDEPFPIDAQERACRALGKLGPAIPRSVVPFLFLAADRNVDLRPTVADTLVQIGGDDVSKPLRERSVGYTTTPPQARAWAIQTLGKLDPKVLSDRERPILKETLLDLKYRDPNLACRVEAETAYARLTANGLIGPGK
jgi:S1-C subfamily serine protease